MHDNSAISIGRIDRFLSEWIAPAVIRQAEPLDVSLWEAPGEPVSFSEAVTREFVEGAVGAQWGRPWGTTWFHVVGQMPQSWPLSGTRAEIIVDLGWIVQQPGFQAEGAAWNASGALIKGISPRNHFVPVAPVSSGNAVDFYVEGASNPDVPGGVWTAPTKMGDKATAGDDLLYRLRQFDLVLVDEDVEALLADARALRSLMEVLPKDSQRRAELIVALENMCDAVDPDNVARTASEGREALAGALSEPAAASAHEVYAVGHAHIDSAWLWPTRETERKVGRTVGNVLALMDQYDDFKYAFSSAQQYKWIKEKYPELYARLKERVAEGRVIPVGGMWVEPDTNMPGGEALARQFVAGKSFFRNEFGLDSTSVWLPDSFGYTGSLPQIAQQAGLSDLLTQKLTWNDTNVMPHSTFWWEGADGSRVFTHFPPVATYNSDLSSPEMQKAAVDFADKGLANKSLAPFGYGDGGGGPTREMILQGRRLANLEGSPVVHLTGPDEFFSDARRQYADAAPAWVGEMYLEYHRGTYTTQQRTKKGNRRSEGLLHQAELWATAAAVRVDAEYPYSELEEIWEQVLLLQFHDILPGTSIAWVHREAEESYARIEAQLEGIIERSLGQLAAGEGNKRTFVANAAARTLGGVAPFTIEELAPLSQLRPAPATILREEGGWVLENDGVRIRLDKRGLIISAYDKTADREVIRASAPGNLLQMFRDIPNSWEAWDIETHYKRAGCDITDVDEITQTISPDGEPGVRISRTFSNSTVVQILWLEPGNDPTLHVTTSVDWHEKQKLLKLAFPLDVVTDNSESEMQFGFVTRPTHDNTSWDAAKFETVAHRWVRAGEQDYGVVLANDCTYGFDIARIRVEERPGTLIRVSLLRAPLFPDPVADQGEHVFRHSISLNSSINDAYLRGYALNLPLRKFEAVMQDQSNLEALVSVTGDVEVSAVKMAQDRSGDVIVRVFEPNGNRVRARLDYNFPHTGMEVVGLLEEPGLHAEFLDVDALDLVDGGAEVSLRPFQMLTIRATR